ncbi:MAG: Na/Pi cotransporter family protein [Verrucomicrobiota bacterium]
MDILGIAIGGLGGLALFLYGMHKMSDGLQAAAGPSMKLLLTRLTRNRFVAAITGAVTTAVLQSSSITTVLVVGFVGAGLMTLPQTVGIIMGANVGTTITAQMLAFNITELAWLMVGLGFLSWNIAKRDFTRNIGTILMGFGMLFIGMGQMGEATYPLREHPPFIDLMARMDQVFLAILLGAAFTALVQSSSATIGIVIMLASQGHISLEAGIALGIGATIGTCVTALLAGIGKSAESRRVGVVHVLHNSIGALLWFPFIDQLGFLAIEVSPTHPELEGVVRMAEEVPRQIANAITIYAATNLAVLIWFAGPVAKLASWLVKDRPEPKSEQVEPRYLDPVFLKTPSIAIDHIRLELSHLGELVQSMLEGIPNLLTRGTPEDFARVMAQDDEIDHLHEEILNYTSLLSREELNQEDSRRIEKKLEIASNLEAIGDLIETNLLAQSQKRRQQEFDFSKTAEEAVIRLHEEVSRGLDDVLCALVEEEKELAIEVNARKKEVEGLVDQANDRLSREFFSRGGKNVYQFRVESDVVDQTGRLFYRVRRIAKAIAGESLAE